MRAALRIGPRAIATRGPRSSELEVGVAVDQERLKGVAPAHSSLGLAVLTRAALRIGPRAITTRVPRLSELEVGAEVDQGQLKRVAPAHSSLGLVVLTRAALCAGPRTITTCGPRSFELGVGAAHSSCLAQWTQSDKKVQPRKKNDNSGGTALDPGQLRQTAIAE
jgi:hypothetical protein